MLQRRVFVSYRRATDAAAALALVASLKTRIDPASVFHDVAPESLPPGTTWPVTLLEAILRAEIVLPVIGPGWLDELKGRNRSPEGAWISSTRSNDWVRKEIALALGVGKVVVPLLVGRATLPTVSDLPPDLRALPERQHLSLPEGETRLLDRLAGPLDTPPTPTVWPWEEEPAPAAEEEHGIYTRFGQRWSERNERDTPHSYDYKFSILDPETRHRLRVMLLAAGEAGQLSAAFSLALLEQLGEPRKFAHSEKKEGLFLQASCLVTDGMDTGDVRRVLLCIRDDYQLHDLTRESRRHVQGEACLHSTCLTSFHKLDTFGHLSTAILNSSTSPNPWALFSRKLLFPDALIDCRFLGIGYNFSKPNREYVFLVWHVRTRHCPPLMLVPARQEAHYDDPLWQSLDEVAQFDFERAPVDRLVLEQGLGIRFEDGRVGVNTPLIGFVPCTAFDLTHQNRQMPVRWFRDTVVLDLLRLYQQQIHRGRRAAPASSQRALLDDLRDYLRPIIQEAGLTLDVELLTGSSAGAGEFDTALSLTLRDEERRLVYPFLVVAALTEEERLSSAVRDQCRRELASGFRQFGECGVGLDPKALFVLQGVRSDQRYRLQGAVTLHAGTVPIHVVKVALLPAVGETPVREVAHAIIPVCRGNDGPIEGLLVTRSFDDELPRLPGGKVEDDEQVGEALLRELHEELDLPAGEVRETIPVDPQGLVVQAVSPSTGRLTTYHFYPFVVILTERGQLRMRDLVTQSGRSCRVAPVTLSDFRETGLGFDPAYAQAILDKIPPEVLRRAAVPLREGSHPGES